MKRTPRLFILSLPWAAAAIVVGAGHLALAGEEPRAAPAADPVGVAERTPDDPIAALVAFLDKGDDEKPGEGRHEGERRHAEGRTQDHRGDRRGGERPRGDREESGRRDDARRGSPPGGDATRAERDHDRAERDRARAERGPEGQRRRPFDDGPPRVARPEMAGPEARRGAPLVRPQPRGQSMPMVPLVPAQPHVPQAATAPQVGPGGAVVLPPQVRHFAIHVGPDGVARAVPADAAHAPPAPAGGPHGERQQITVQIDGGQLKLEGIPGMGGPLNLGALPGGAGLPGGNVPVQVEAKVLRLDGLHAGQGDAHAHVGQLLERILDKVNAIESRLGGPGAQGQHPQPLHHPAPPPQAPGPQPHHPQGMAGPQPPHGQPGPQQVGPHGNPPHPGPHQGGVNPDEINRRFEEQARELHRRMEEMQRHLAERVQAGGGEQMKQWHQKLVETHEKIQQSFQDIRKRFAEQQERIERLEQEVRRMREELERPGAATGQPPRKPVSIEGDATL